MAGGGPSLPSSGRRKSLDAEINLVPFIDLLSMCICFLLMTAVWMEIGALNVKQLVGTGGPSDSKPSYELEVKYLNPASFDVVLSHPGKKSEKFSVQGASLTERIDQFRRVLKTLSASLNLDARGDIKSQVGQAISAAKVSSKAGVSYGEVIGVMDAMRDLGIVNLGLVPVRE